MEEKNYQYETKCRRCGEMTEWHFAPVVSVTWLEFVKAMLEYIKYPPLNRCKKCNKYTVQDVISCSPAGGE